MPGPSASAQATIAPSAFACLTAQKIAAVVCLSRPCPKCPAVVGEAPAELLDPAYIPPPKRCPELGVGIGTHDALLAGCGHHVDGIDFTASYPPQFVCFAHVASGVAVRIQAPAAPDAGSLWLQGAQRYSEHLAEKFSRMPHYFKWPPISCPDSSTRIGTPAAPSDSQSKRSASSRPASQSTLMKPARASSSHAWRLSLPTSKHERPPTAR